MTDVMMIRGLGPAHDTARCRICRAPASAGAGLDKARAAGITECLEFIRTYLVGAGEDEAPA